MTYYEALALSEKFHTAPDWWLEQSPMWLTMARQYVRLQAAQMKRETDTLDMEAELRSYASRIGGGRWTM